VTRPNHTTHIGGIDLFAVPTIGFKLLYGLVRGHTHTVLVREEGFV
jgi:hypothetical protein